MKTRLPLLLLLLPLLGMRKCEKEPEPALVLPPATQTGANTLGFVADGRVWTTYGSTCYFGVGGCAANALLADYTARSRNLFMTTRLSTPKRYESFYLTVDSLVRVGSYPTTAYQAPGTIPRARRSLNLTVDVGDMVNETHYDSFPKGSKATITITKFDTIQRIIAGTFEGTLRPSGDSTKQIHVTDGRFDVRYR